MASLLRWKVRYFPNPNDPVEKEVKQTRLFREYRKAANSIRRRVKLGESAKVSRITLDPKQSIIAADDWGRVPLDKSIGVVTEPVSQIFLHTNAGTVLANDATRETEGTYARGIQATAFSRGFLAISYSYGVAPSGRIYEFRGDGRTQAATTCQRADCSGQTFNSKTYSICLMGHGDNQKLTKPQEDAIVWLINRMQKDGSARPKVDVRGHREVAPKSCPGNLVTDEDIARIQRRVNAVVA